jgi:predicted O-methyltransferase YrrM
MTSLDSAIDFVKEEAEALQGAFSQYDMMALYPALIKIPEDGLYVEVGVRNGRSLMFARKHSKGTVVGIDKGHEILLDKFKNVQDWEFIHKESDEAVKDWDRKIDVLFIDADHTYEGCLADWNNFSPFVKKGGIVYFHDCDDTSPGVEQVFDEIGEGWTDKTLWKDKLDGRKTSVASVVKL